MTQQGIRTPALPFQPIIDWVRLHYANDADDFAPDDAFPDRLEPSSQRLARVLRAERSSVVRWRGKNRIPLDSVDKVCCKGLGVNPFDVYGDVYLSVPVDVWLCVPSTRRSGAKANYLNGGIMTDELRDIMLDTC